MLYTLLLIAHSWIRWLVLITLVFAIYRAVKGWASSSEFKRMDGLSRNLASIMVRIQFVIGVVLYFVSPITRYFISNIKDSFGVPQLAVLGWMHPVGMIIAIVLISIGEARSKKAAEDNKKFSGTAISYTIALLIILVSIPWPFTQSPRPLFRGF